jgi:WD40 repeat protein
LETTVQSVNDALYSDDGQRLAVRTNTGLDQVWNAKTYEMEQSFYVAEEEIIRRPKKLTRVERMGMFSCHHGVYEAAMLCVVLSPGAGCQLASSHKDGTVRLWDVESVALS